MKILTGIQTTDKVKPTILLGLENSNGAILHAELSPDEARVVGLQLKVLADSIDRMAVDVVTGAPL